MAGVAAPVILRHTTGFIDEVLIQPDLRHRIITSARLKLPSPLDPSLLQALTLISQSFENSPAAERLLLMLPIPTPLSSLLLALAYGYRRRQVSAGLALLELFSIDPAFARLELAQPVFESLFIPHLLPAIEQFTERRSKISSASGGQEKVYARVLSCEQMTLLSRMSGGQAEELRELERGYEDMMDENCRIYADYLKKVLEGSNEPCPQLVFIETSDGARGLGELEEEQEEEEGQGELEEEEEQEEEEGGERIEFEPDGRYNNVMSLFLLVYKVFDFFPNRCTGKRE